MIRFFKSYDHYKITNYFSILDILPKKIMSFFSNDLHIEEV
jgi:hypothetical protein